MEITELLSDLKKIFKNSKFGKYIVSQIFVNSDLNIDENVDLENQSDPNVEKNLKGKNKGYKFIFKMK